jgi:hypothetical protein
MKVYSESGSVMMEVKSLERRGNSLILIGTVAGGLPLRGYLKPNEFRSLIGLLTRARLMWFALTFVFRRHLDIPQSES